MKLHRISYFHKIVFLLQQTEIDKMKTTSMISRTTNVNPLKYFCRISIQFLFLCFNRLDIGAGGIVFSVRRVVCPWFCPVVKLRSCLQRDVNLWHAAKAAGGICTVLMHLCFFFYHNFFKTPILLRSICSIHCLRHHTMLSNYRCA